MDKVTIPINFIGESNWTEKLTDFLENYDIEVLGLDEFRNEFKLPDEVVAYYIDFGGIESSDFMYNLYKIEKFTNLSESEWSFVKENFSEQEQKQYIVFTESPGNDPVCFDKNNFSIWLFSHDPLKKAKVFEDFNQYLRYEIIELLKLMGEVVFDGVEEILYHEKHFSGDHIDLALRSMKFL